MTDRMTAEDRRRFEKLMSQLITASGNERHASYKPMTRRKRKSAARMKVKR